METEHDIRHTFDLKDLRESEVLIYSVSYAGNAYGRDTSGQNPGSIFFHKSQTEKFDIKPGDMFRARYVPNYDDRRDDVPWRTIYIFSPAEREAAKQAPAPAPVVAAPVAPQQEAKPLTPADLKKRVDDLVLTGQVWTTREVFYALFKREVDYKRDADRLASATIGNHLRALCRAEKLHRIELYRYNVEQAYAVYFSADIDALKPEGY
jgi:hypothetical protein